MAFHDGLKLKHAKLDALAALRAPVSTLLGVSSEIEQTLAKLGIRTVYDLAASPLFRVSAELVDAADGVGDTAMARLGRVPAEIVDADEAITPAALLDKDVSVFRDIGTALGAEIKSRLQVETAGELGRWPAFRSARAILDTAIPPRETGDGIVSELVPRLGEYPTERHYYRSVVIDHVVPGTTTDLGTAGPVDLAPAVSSDFGFRAPAVGAIITFAQSWFAQGITLGNMLHSVALAPGESTRIAVVDWSRRTSASGQEAISESERLTNASTHSRAISEVQDAVATEVQSGFSKSSGTSKTSAGGAGLGISIGPVSFGGSASTAKTTTTAESFSSSAGSRNLSASMSQRVSDATQQAASSVRERRASIVKEVSETEHESVSTRILANYNHMHALTVQYFEVIEIYRVMVQVQQVERCLFVPMKLIEFNDATIERFQAVLADAALTRRARELLSTEPGMVRLQPAQPVRRINIFDHVGGLDRLSAATTAFLAARPAGEGPDRPDPPEPPEPGDGGGPVRPPPVATPPVVPPELTSWSSEELARAARITMCGVVRPNIQDVFLPGDAELVGVTFSLQPAQGTAAAALTSVQITTHAGATTAFAARSPLDWAAPIPVPLQEIDQLRVSSAVAMRQLGRVTLQFVYRGARFPISLPVDVVANATGQVLMRALLQESGTELRLHLQENRLHYSQAIWRSLDSSTAALLLSGFSFEGIPVADLIDPNPVMVAGNYLVFRMPAFVEALGVPTGREEANTPLANARRAWQDWLVERGLTLGSESAAEQLVPIPTGGVFAEAVLGRSNSAEKLDATRFWNWQDSPIPLQPPEISAIQLASRAQPIDVTPGQLGQPVLNIMNPTSLPDPTGLGAAMGAIQNGGMFRDMSGLAATAALAGSLSTNATNAGTEAGRQAAANLAVAAQKDIESQRIAAQVAMAAMGLPGANAGTPKNISEGGALLNTASAMDAKAGQMPGPGESGGGASGPIMGGGGDGGSSGGGEVIDGSFMPGVGGSTGTMSRADDVRNRLTWGNFGLPAGSVVLAQHQGSGSGQPGASATTIYELSLHGGFPNPFASVTDEDTALGNNTWSPSEDDLESVGKAATSASNATKPFAQTIATLDDILSTVKYFAPLMRHTFAGQGPLQSRVKRLNLLAYAGGSVLALKGTMQTTGGIIHAGVSPANMSASVVNAAALDKVRKAAANKTALAELKKAWDVDAEVWLYNGGGVPSDALCKALARFLGARVRTFDEKFFVIPVLNAQTQTFDRVKVGIGSDFADAKSRAVPDLKSLDSQSNRSFAP
ncbi:hypothetical protein [Taklimakanibacter lacteus]|uniref:hypothetical protein n=1 Tax=Taklimakanibacter lacteus TaxID=2268456 RepID=UPI000E663D0D